MSVLQTGLSLAKTRLISTGSVTIKQVTIVNPKGLYWYRLTPTVLCGISRSLNITEIKWKTGSLPFLPGPHQQLPHMLLGGLSQREDPKHWDLSPHRLREDHPDRAHPLLHRQNSTDSRGNHSDHVCLIWVRGTITQEAQFLSNSSSSDCCDLTE